jgi:hypothetical protein
MQYFDVECTHRKVIAETLLCCVRLHRSNQEHSTACLTFMICKYQDPYFIPCCNLQSMNMYVHWFAIYIFSDFRWEVKINRKSEEAELVVFVVSFSSSSETNMGLKYSVSHGLFSEQKPYVQWKIKFKDQVSYISFWLRATCIHSTLTVFVPSNIF